MNNISLYPWQSDIINEMGGKNGLIVLPPGVGKSMIGLHYIQKHYGKDKILIISSKWVLHQWTTDYLQNYNFLIWNNKKQKIAQHNIILCNFSMIGRKDNYGWLLEHKFNLILIDESHHLQNRHSLQTKNILTICANNPTAQIILMTATPCPEGDEEQLQPQIECIDPLSKVGNRKMFETLFLKTTFENVGKHTEIIVPKKTLVHKDIFLRFCDPYIYPKKQYNFPLPEQIFKDIKLNMPDDLSKIYQEVKDTCSLYIQEHDFQMFFTAGLWQKLLQVSCGFIYDPISHEPTNLSSDKIEQLKEMLPDIIEDKKCLIFSSYPVEIKKAHEILSKHYKCEMIYGGMSPKQVSNSIENFKHKKLQILIANPECIGEGISFECCARQIHLSISPRGLIYSQAVGRTNRINQKDQEIIFRIFYNKPEIVKLMKLVQTKGLKEKDIIKALFSN